MAALGKSEMGHSTRGTVVFYRLTDLRKKPLAQCEGRRHLDGVLGGTAALHSHSTVGGCIFFGVETEGAGGTEGGGVAAEMGTSLRNSGLCQPQAWQR